MPKHPKSAIILNESTLNELRNILEDRFPILLKSFLNSTNNLMLELQNSATNDDSKGVKAAAHSILSSCLHIGAEQLASYMQDLEILGQEGKLDDTTKELIEKSQTEYQKLCIALEKHRA